MARSAAAQQPNRVGNPKSAATDAFDLVRQTTLVQAVAGGDTEAFEALYMRHSALLFSLARRILHTPEEAAEVVQEVFLAAWRNARRYDPTRASVLTWLVVMTRSRAIDRLRSRAIRERVDHRLADQDDSWRPESASGGLLDSERRRRVRNALSQLPLSQRQVVELAYFEGLTQSEIAGRLGTPLGTVKTRTLLAFRKLRRDLAEEIDALL